MRSFISFALLLAIIVPALAHAETMTVADDPAPLLYDRVRQYPLVVIVTPVKDFATKATPQKDTNAVLLPLTVDKTIKGEAKPALRLSVHENLPRLLAERDAKYSGQYLLALQTSKDYVYLGAAHLYTDLARIIPCDDSLAKVVDAFITVKDESPTALARLCLKLSQEKGLSAPAADALFELLARVVPKAELDAKEIAALTDVLQSRIGAGVSVGPSASALRQVTARPDWAGAIDPKALAALRENLTRALSKDHGDLGFEQRLLDALALVAAGRDDATRDALKAAAQQQSFPRLAAAAREAMVAAGWEVAPQHRLIVPDDNHGPLLPQKR